MPITEILKQKSEWTNGEGPESDVVVSSRVRLARNLAGRPFPARLDTAGAEKLLADVKAACTAPDYEWIALSELSPAERQALVEKHLISPEQAREGPRALLLRKDQALSVMVNEEDHLRIQCLLPALRLEDALAMAFKVDDMLAAKLDFAHDANFGYLTACPSNVGTGLRASVMLHLPGLVRTKRIERLFADLPKLGLTMRGLYGEGSKAQGDLFQLSNQVTLGLSEQEIVNRLKNVLMQLLEQERQARCVLQEKASMKLYDQLWRAFGLLGNARAISTEEAMELLSRLRLGMELGVFPEFRAAQINELMVALQPCNLQLACGKTLSPEQRDWERASLIRDSLFSFNGGEKHE